MQTLNTLKLQFFLIKPLFSSRSSNDCQNNYSKLCYAKKKRKDIFTFLNSLPSRKMMRAPKTKRTELAATSLWLGVGTLHQMWSIIYFVIIIMIMAFHENSFTAAIKECWNQYTCQGPWESWHCFQKIVIYCSLGVKRKLPSTGQIYREDVCLF